VLRWSRHSAADHRIPPLLLGDTPPPPACRCSTAAPLRSRWRRVQQDGPRAIRRVPPLGDLASFAPTCRCLWAAPRSGAWACLVLLFRQHW